MPPLDDHSIVSLMNGTAAKVRCRTCYSDHDYRNEQAPPTKKELLKQKELFNAVLAGAVPPEAPASNPVLTPVTAPIELPAEAPKSAKKK